MNKFKLTMLMLLLTMATSCWAKGMKGNLESNELDFFYNTVHPILIKANICHVTDGDCVSGDYSTCWSLETLSCDFYGITDEKVIREILIAMLNTEKKDSQFRVSSFTFWREKYRDFYMIERLWKRPILKFVDHTDEK